MPGPAIHHHIAQQIIRNLNGPGIGKNMSTADRESMLELLKNPANLPYLFLGAQGPDFLFFNLKDIDPNIGRFVKAYLEVSEAIEGFKKAVLDAIPQPILDALEGIEEIAEDSPLFGELIEMFKDINQLLEGVLTTLTEAVKRFISELNIFGLLDHPYRDGVEADDNWWWFDALHYRKTGEFAKELLSATGGATDRNHLYALGYLSHVAGDAVGHPLVNIMSGGSYRSHAQRHKTVENYQDVFEFSPPESTRDFNRSRIHAFYNFNYDGLKLDDEDFEDKLDVFTSLPEDLAKIIADTINKVYQEDLDADAEYGRTISASDVDTAYKLWYKWFRNATDTGTIPEPVPYSLTKELREVWEAAIDDLGDAGDFVKKASDQAGDGNFWSILLFLAAIIIATILATKAFIDALIGTITTLSTATIRYGASLIYEQLYSAFQDFRLGTALNGLAFPLKEHLNHPALRHFANPAFSDSNGRNANTIASSFPLLRWNVPFDINSPESFFSSERHLIYPLSNSEPNSVMGAPAYYFDKSPTFHIASGLPFSPDLIDKIAELASKSNIMDNDDGSQLAKLLQEEGLGSIIDLTGVLYERWREGKVMPNFNLDGDRGYGYLCWSQVRSSVPPQTDPVDFPTELDVNPVELRFIPNS